MMDLTVPAEFFVGTLLVAAILFLAVAGRRLAARAASPSPAEEGRTRTPARALIGAALAGVLLATWFGSNASVPGSYNLLLIDAYYAVGIGLSAVAIAMILPRTTLSDGASASAGVATVAR